MKSNGLLGWLISPAALVLFLGLIYLGAVLQSFEGDPLVFANIGTQFSQDDPAGSEGYDGQFVYYIARDPNPQNVAPFLDVPSYRYQRILLPLLARTLSLGIVGIIPWLLPIIGLIAHTAATYLLGKMLADWGVSRWYSLSYGLWVGILLSIRLDLPEALAFSLIIAAIHLSRRGQNGLAWLAYGLALFAKETTLFFIAAHFLIYLVQRRGREAIGLSMVALLPFALFQGWLFRTFGEIGLSSGGIRATQWELLPFNGLWRMGELSIELMLSLLAVYLPTIILPALWGILVSLRSWQENGPELYSSALLVNAAIFPFLPFSLYSEPIGALRFACGLVLAIVLFSARYRILRALNFSLFWMALNAILLSGLFSS